MEILRQICQADPAMLLATRFKSSILPSQRIKKKRSCGGKSSLPAAAKAWLCSRFDFVVNGRKGLVQPATKVRGREYLRIIYGPEYTLPENLGRLRSRGLGVKRSLALREFALGLEALERFVHKEPLRRVHECVFGVLALESEPVNPRL